MTETIQKASMELSVARAIAKSKYELLRPLCDLIDVAGSIRRSNAIVGDIEILCAPRVSASTTDLFGATSDIKRSKQFVDTIKSLGEVIKGDPEKGRFVQIKLPEGIVLDLFMPQKDDYFRQLAIRTGPALYSKSVIAAGWSRLGWCGTSDGLRLKSECAETKLEGGKSTWRCILPKPTLPPVWLSEEEFFKWIQVKYAEPSKR
ncbi:MAG: hypothetical protein IM631_12570 [Cytophagales bacterium]|nr:hypothetical protein [Cytophagales bacterium]MCA6382349.1 hypothetical protein [Cytophagales bacterium]